MKKILLVLLLVGVTFGTPAFAATKKSVPAAKKVTATKQTVKKTAVKKTTPTAAAVVTNVAVAKGQLAPPPGYLELISTAHTAYVKASAQAKANHSKTALAAAEKAYAEAMEEASKMLGN